MNHWTRTGYAPRNELGQSLVEHDEDDALADADYESWAGPWWWRICERYPAAIAIVATLLGMTPYFWGL